MLADDDALLYFASLCLVRDLLVGFFCSSGGGGGGCGASCKAEQEEYIFVVEHVCVCSRTDSVPWPCWSVGPLVGWLVRFET